MNTKTSVLVIPIVLICASVFRPKSNSKIPTSLETSVDRQETTCDSKSDCSVGEVCVGSSGICESTNCNGVCFQESAFTNTCSCQDPCSSGFTCSSRKVEGVEIRVCLPESLSDFLPDDVAENLTSPFAPLDCSSPKPLPSPVATGPPLFSPSPTPSFSQSFDSAAICIGVDMLTAFPHRELVDEVHFLSKVLCDVSESCATRGHIVYYKGKAMMMKSYCDLVGCKDKIMKVNSPRYVQGLKVPSRSDDLQFTAFSARYETRVEEIIMSAAIHVGM